MLIESIFSDNFQEFTKFIISAAFSENLSSYILSKSKFINTIFKEDDNYIALNLMRDAASSNKHISLEEITFIYELHLPDSPNAVNELLQMTQEFDSISSITEEGKERLASFKKIFQIKLGEIYLAIVNEHYKLRKISFSELTSLIADFNDSSDVDPFDNPDFAQTLNLDELNPDEIEKDYIDDVIKSSFIPLNESYPEGGIIRGQLGVILAPPGVGKTLWLLNLVASFLHPKLNPQNLKIIYFVLGDMNKYNLTVRLLSICLNISQYEIRKKGNFKKYFEMAKEKYPYLFDLNRLRFVLLKPGKFTAEQCIKYMKKTYTSVLGEDGKITSVSYFDLYDVKIYDYDNGFAYGSDIKKFGGLEMYLSGGETYNILKASTEEVSKFTGKQSISLVACQPKVGKADKEYIDMDDMSESAQKQRVIDFMITLASPYAWRKKNFIGVMRAVKGRNADLFTAYYLKDISGRFIIIEEEVAKNIISQQLDVRYTSVEDLIGKQDFVSIINNNSKDIPYKNEVA